MTLDNILHNIRPNIVIANMRSERFPVFADINDVLSLASLTGPAVRDIERASLSHSFTNNLHLSLYQNFSSYL